MRKMTYWTERRKKNHKPFIGFKIVEVHRNVGKLAIKSPYWDYYWNSDTVLESDGNSTDSFFHMYTSIYDAICSEQFDMRQPLYKATKAIIAVRPEGKVIFGLDNNGSHHTFGCKSVSWTGKLIFPSRRGFKYFDVYERSSFGRSLVQVKKNIHINELHSYV